MPLAEVVTTASPGICPQLQSRYSRIERRVPSTHKSSKSSILRKCLRYLAIYVEMMEK